MNLESEQDVYARLLTRAEPKRGYPLWCPEPSTQLPTEYHDDGYRIGDVGVVTEHGSFDVFFNICLPSSHPLHSRYGVPEGFKQIRLSDRDIESFEHFDKRGRVVSTRSITQTNLAVGGSTSGASPVQGGLNLHFNSSATEGAILVLPEGSDQHNLRNYLVFQKEALLNGKAWYEFAVTRLGRTTISPDSLYLITGFHKTSSWSLAAFNNAGRSLNFDVHFTAGNIVNGNVTAAYTWQTSSTVPCRVGPDPFEGKKNQTVFIRGIKIATRKSIFRHILGDVAISYQSPSSVLPKVHFTRGMKGLLATENGDAGQASGGSAVVGGHEQNPTDTLHPPELSDPGVHEDCGLADLSLNQAPVISKIYHPSDLINQIILDKEPSCDIAVTHDDLWADILEELPSGKVHPDDISEAIKCECSKYSIVSFLGAAYFSRCSNSTKPGLDGDDQKQYSSCAAEFLKTQTSDNREMASTSLFSGIEVLYQVPPLPAFPCALHNPTSLLSNPETMEDVPPSFGHRAHPSSPLGGPSVMPWTARDPAVHLPIPMETYNPPSTVCPTSCPIGPGGSQMLWGVKSPSDQNNQRASPANACPLADETPPDDKPYTPYNRVQQRCGWRSQDGTPCGTVITYSCQGHFALAHGITQLSGQTHLLCRWCHPAHQIKREHLLRHIREVHLGFPRWKRERA